MIDDTARIDALEMRLAEQERTIDDLNAVVTAQWDAIEALKRSVARLIERLPEAESPLPRPPSSGSAAATDPT